MAPGADSEPDLAGCLLFTIERDLIGCRFRFYQHPTTTLSSLVSCKLLVLATAKREEIINREVKFS